MKKDKLLLFIVKLLITKLLSAQNVDEGKSVYLTASTN